MKNTILISGLLLSSAFVRAQNGWHDNNKSSTFTVGIEAGVAATNLTTDVKTVELTAKKHYNMRYGLRVGIPVNIDIKQRVDIRTGLYYAQKGFNKMHIDEGDEGSEDVNMYINYLELPVSLLLRVGHNRKLYFGPGAYLARAVSGKDIINGGAVRELMFKPESYHHNYYPDSVPYTFKPWDLGLTATVGYRFCSHLFLQAQYQQGIMDIGRYSVPGYKNSYTNYGFCLTAGFMLGK